MGNSPSDLSKAGGSSNEDLSRKKKEKDDQDALDTAKMVAALGVGALAGWGLTKLLSSSSSSGLEEELDSTHGPDSHDMMEANDGRLIRWRFPACGKLKMNTDGSVINSKDGSGGRAGFGGVIRDERGFCIMCFYGKLRDDCSILQAELWAIYKGLKIIQSRDLSEVEIESDSKAAISLIKNVKNENMKAIRTMLLSMGCTLKHTLREGNRVADKLAKLGRDGDSNFVSFNTPRKEIRSLLDADVASAGFVRGAR
jgi:ribonuclease HI